MSSCKIYHVTFIYFALHLGLMKSFQMNSINLKNVQTRLIHFFLLQQIDLTKTLLWMLIKQDIIFGTILNVKLNESIIVCYFSKPFNITLNFLFKPAFMLHDIVDGCSIRSYFGKLPMNAIYRQLFFQCKTV